MDNNMLITQQEHNAYSYPAQRFNETVEELNLPHQRYAQWSTDAENADLQVYVERGFSSRYNDDNSLYVAFTESDSKAAGWIQLQSGLVYVTVAAQTAERAESLLADIENVIPRSEETDTESEVSIGFWSLGPQGPSRMNRRIAVPVWDEIKNNYTKDVKESLESLMEIKSGKDLGDGQLILWQGEPGTGKTYALRSLASAWHKWCEFHYITDPEQFFGSHSNYMLNVILHDSNPYGVEEEPRWKLLILEDSGELLRADAKQVVGQALSRLLNTVDGLIGQGLRLLVLVTTNEEMEKLHPAVSRHGRCLQQAEFGPLTRDEVRAWMDENDIEGDVVPMSAANLYALKNGKKAEEKRLVGFH
jgi:hypothetical protein